ncbi:MAG: hypothetical protein Q4B50_05940 [Bacillota bacterium]|nr:hypothetical protein [Bacillota bacterium]
MSIFFTAQFDKFFALMKTAFPDYERYANMPNEPENADDRFIFPGRETREDLLEEEKMKYNLAQQLKKLQEINTLWKNESSWENDPAGFVRSMKELHQEANRFQKAYSKGLKTVGDSSDRIFLQKCIADTTHTNTWLVTQMEKTIKQPNQNFLINRDSLAEVKNASQAALNRRIKAKMRNKDTHQFFSAIYDKMAESSRKVMWNSSEYRVIPGKIYRSHEGESEQLSAGQSERSGGGK